MKWAAAAIGIGISVAGGVLTLQPSEPDTPDAAVGVLSSKLFHSQATQKPGLLIPLYIAPSNVHTNADFNAIMKLKRRYREIPFWVILNPASGPGTSVNANYTKAIDRLIGSGCVVVGYVPTGYGNTSVRDVSKDLKAWQTMYPRVQGIFFDEMIYEDTASGVAHQQQLNDAARNMGYWPTIGNPGADTPGRYFAGEVADVIVVHESGSWPTEAKLHGDYFGGYSDYPPSTRAVMVHSQPTCDDKAIAMCSQYTQWIYVTQDTYKANDPAHPNPWDNLSVHLETMCRTLTNQ